MVIITPCFFTFIDFFLLRSYNAYGIFQLPCLTNHMSLSTSHDYKQLNALHSIIIIIIVNEMTAISLLLIVVIACHS